MNHYTSSGKSLFPWCPMSRAFCETSITKPLLARYNKILIFILCPASIYIGQTLWRMAMPKYHIAQVNIGRIRGPLDSATMHGFMSRLDEISIARSRPSSVIGYIRSVISSRIIWVECE